MITEPMRRALLNLIAGDPVDTGIHGRSEYGGLYRTLYALRRRGLIDSDCNITAAGRFALRRDGPDNAIRG